MPSQGAAETTPAQVSPVQQAAPPTVHCCPEPTQAPAWQVPVVDPEGTTQVSPEQQSAPEVQLLPATPHDVGVAHFPATQARPTQQSELVVQLTAAAAQPVCVWQVPAPAAGATGHYSPWQHCAELVQPAEAAPHAGGGEPAGTASVRAPQAAASSRTAASGTRFMTDPPGPALAPPPC